MALFLRRWRRQNHLRGREHLWRDDEGSKFDYAVVDDYQVGRMIRRMSAPTEGQWDWFLHVAGDRSDVHIHGTADSLEDAKAQFKAEYEKWLAKNGRNKLK